METERNLEPKPEISSQEGEQQARDRMGIIQLEYALKVKNGEVAPLGGKEKPADFEQAILEYTTIPRGISEAYYQRTGRHGDSEKNPEFVIITQKILSEICGAYEENNDLSVLPKKIHDIIEKVVNTLPQKEFEKKENTEREKAGLLSFMVTDNYIKGLDTEGIADDAKCADIHFDAFFRSKDENDQKPSLFRLKDSLKALAKIIQDQHPEVQLIGGRSWILDTNLAKKLGFKITDEEFSVGNGFWGQFVDQKGEIKEDKVEEFLKTGVPEYRLKVGYIPVKEFLEKYGEDK